MEKWEGQGIMSIIIHKLNLKRKRVKSFIKEFENCSLVENWGGLTRFQRLALTLCWWLRMQFHVCWDNSADLSVLNDSRSISYLIYCTYSMVVVYMSFGLLNGRLTSNSQSFLLVSGRCNLLLSFICHTSKSNSQFSLSDFFSHCSTYDCLAKWYCRNFFQALFIILILED